MRLNGRPWYWGMNGLEGSSPIPPSPLSTPPIPTGGPRFMAAYLSGIAPTGTVLSSYLHSSRSKQFGSEGHLSFYGSSVAKG
jgi:hypothetical protein